MKNTKEWETVQTDWFNDVVWRTGNGDETAVNDMTASHLLNAMNFMEMTFFYTHPERYDKDWYVVHPRIHEIWPMFTELAAEAYGRSNPWKTHNDGKTRFCGNVLEAYRVLKRGEDQRSMRVTDDGTVYQKRAAEVYYAAEEIRE